MMTWFEAYRAADPLVAAWIGCTLVAALCWLGSLATGNYSQVDRLWSILPVLYVFHFGARQGFADPRLAVMALLALLWGARLTYNYARKGGYTPGSEDYRWPEVRSRMGAVQFQVFNVVFVAAFQNALLLMLATPAYVAGRPGARPLNAMDALATLLFLGFLAGETLADQQQWRFHLDKSARPERGERAGRDFLTTGLFRYSRHPNFFCEQGMWWSFYLFAVAATGSWIQWPILGAAILTLLFQGSTGLTEELTLRKYPDYATYQKTTSRLLPLPPKR